MNDFTFYCPTKFVFGKQAEQKTGQLCKESGASHVLLVTGGSSAQKSGLLRSIQDSLTESGLQVSSLSGVKPNPRALSGSRGDPNGTAEGHRFYSGRRRVAL